MQLRWGFVTTLALMPFIATVASSFVASYLWGLYGLIIYMFGGWVAVLVLSALVAKGIALSLQAKVREPMRVDQ